MHTGVQDPLPHQEKGDRTAESRWRDAEERPRETACARKLGSTLPRP